MIRSIIVFSLLLVTGCSVHRMNKVDFMSDHISAVITKMTDVMVHDVTNPPLAARFFSYACLAGYEVISENTRGYSSMYKKLNGYPNLERSDSIRGYAYQLSALLAMLETAAKLQPSGKLLLQYEKELLDSCKSIGIADDVIENSKLYAGAISRKIVTYAKGDNYSKISNYPRYTSLTTEGSWYPTPPAFIAAIEPYFNTVRPFTLDSASQFKPSPPVSFSTDKNSAFFRQMLLNYRDTMTRQHLEIAAFWDCNPFAVQDKGHLQMSLKKISPGAHWLGITGIACRSAKKNFDESMLIFTTVSVGLMDAFMCCWDEKYRSNRIRPETAIRKYIDPDWQPILQTPPFPEYLSGHSTISSASATILTHYFGDKFSYTDSVEVSYGLPPRAFQSFRQAADEAAISRFYGGIHFMDAIDNGLIQGKQVGKWVLNRLKQ